MRSRKERESSSSAAGGNPPQPQQQQQISFEGDELALHLNSIQREIESARASDRLGVLPDKLWLKQLFGIGVNEVTRVLERMPPRNGTKDICGHNNNNHHKGTSVRLQAILLASDCNPRWLTKHLPALAASRNVPLISVKDRKGGSLRLGELVKLRTAIAIGIKIRGNAINRLIEEILLRNKHI